MTERRSERVPVWLVFALPCALLAMTFLPGVNAGFWRVDNPLYAAVALRAYETGSLWTLHAGEQLYFNKPPLAFWAHGAFLRLFGRELWAARLPSLFAAMATLALSVDATRRVAGPLAAMASGVVLALTLEFFRAMHSISLDLWLGMCIAGCVWCVVRGMVSGRALRLSLLAGVFIGAGLMVKPLIALAPLPMLGVWMGVTRQRRALACVPVIAGVAVLVALPWHASMALTHGDLFWGEYFGSQVMARVTTDAHGSEPWWKYFAEIGGTYWPWLATFALGAALLRGERLSSGERRAVLLGLVFTGGWVAMLSVASDKAGRYLIPMYPLASWVSGVWLARAIPWSARLGRAARLVVVAGPLLGVLLMLFGPSPHAPTPEVWRDLRAFVLSHPQEDFVIGPRSRTLGAQVYLMRGQWPGVARWNSGVGEDAGGGLPPAGALMISRRRSALWARASDEVVFENEAFIVWRLSSAWDGDYVERSDAGGDAGDE